MLLNRLFQHGIHNLIEYFSNFQTELAKTIVGTLICYHLVTYALKTFRQTENQRLTFTPRELMELYINQAYQEQFQHSRQIDLSLVDEISMS